VSILAGAAALLGTVVVQVVKVVIVDLPSVVAAAGGVILDAIQK